MARSIQGQTPHPRLEGWNQKSWWTHGYLLDQGNPRSRKTTKRELPGACSVRPPVRVLRSCTSEREGAWADVGEDVRSCAKTGCGRSAHPVWWGGCGSGDSCHGSFKAPNRSYEAANGNAFMTGITSLHLYSTHWSRPS